MKQGRILKRAEYALSTTENYSATNLKFFEHKRFGSCVKVGLFGLTFFSITELEAILKRLKEYDKNDGN